MRYQIYGADLAQTPYLRFISDEDVDQMNAEDVMNYIDKFYQIKRYYEASLKDSSRAFPGQPAGGGDVKLFLAKDKHGSYSLFMQKQPALRRIGLLVPETHPIFNIKKLMEAIYSNYLDEKPHLIYTIRLLKGTGYLNDSIQDYI